MKFLPRIFLLVVISFFSFTTTTSAEMRIRIPTQIFSSEETNSITISDAPSERIQIEPTPKISEEPTSSRRTRRIRSISPTPTPTPTRNLTPTISEKIITPSPTKIVASSSLLDSKQQYILDAINTYRLSQGLGKAQADTYTCNFAQTRAKEIVTKFNHDGFKNRVNTKTLPYPSYASVTENIAMNSDYKKVVTSWINSPGHAKNMRANTPYICVAYSGNYYAYEGWRP